ncbi:MAG: hypothetical protein ACLTKG_06760 [Collinsella intestinalis]
MLQGLSDRETSTMLATMDPDDAAALIGELDAKAEAPAPYGRQGGEGHS